MKLKFNTYWGIFLLIVASIFFIPTTPAYASNVNVVINGTPVEFNSTYGYPIVDQNNRTLVPLRGTMEATGALVGYDQGKATAIVITSHDRIEVPVGKSFFYNNNVKIENDTNAIIYGDRVYLPIRAILESAGYTVEWDSRTNTVNAYNFSYNSSSLTPYATTDLATLTKNILNGNVIYINGGYYATPSYVKSLNNIKVSYANDMNTAIYPQQVHGESIRNNVNSDDYWTTTSAFMKKAVSKYELEDTSNLELADSRNSEFYVYGFFDDYRSITGISGPKLIYPLTEFDENFLNYDNATSTFNGIRVKKENGVLLFNYKDLEKYNIPLY